MKRKDLGVGDVVAEVGRFGGVCQPVRVLALGHICAGGRWRESTLIDMETGGNGARVVRVAEDGESLDPSRRLPPYVVPLSRLVPLAATRAEERQIEAARLARRAREDAAAAAGQTDAARLRAALRAIGIDRYASPWETEVKIAGADMAFLADFIEGALVTDEQGP